MKNNMSACTSIIAMIKTNNEEREQEIFRAIEDALKESIAFNMTHLVELANDRIELRYTDVNIGIDIGKIAEKFHAIPDVVYTMFERVAESDDFGFSGTEYLPATKCAYVKL